MEIGNKEFLLPDTKEVNLYFLGDIHEGNCNTRKDKLKIAVNIIKEDPIGYWIGMGDYIEAITHMSDPRFDPISISRDYEIRDLKDLPQRQFQKVYSYLAPIEDKCLTLLIGNHEAVYIKRHSSDVYDRFVNMFKTSAHEPGEHPFKMGHVGFYRLRFVREKEGKAAKTVTIALNHGIGGGGFREGYPTNLVHDCFKYMYGDINVMGHVHRLVEDRKEVVTMSRAGNEFKEPRVWGISGCFLDSYVVGNTNYFEAQAGRAGNSDIGMLKINIKILRHYNRNYSTAYNAEKIFV